VAKILVADDELSMREFLEILLKKKATKSSAPPTGRRPWPASRPILST